MKQQKNEKLSNVLIGIAGVHHVVSELTLRNLVALPTVRNTAGYDVVVSTPDGRAHAFLQVKTSLKRVAFWPVSPPEKSVIGPDVYYAFVRYQDDERRFEVFLESSLAVLEQVKANLKQYRVKKKKEFPYWALPKQEEGINRLKENWRKWRPGL